MNSFEKLKQKLLELFMLDQPDLDFGIYRIMNSKRAEITQFLNNDLLPQVKETFAQYTSVDKGHLETELDKLTQRLRNDGVDPEQSTKVQELKAKLAESVDLTALENEVYSDLFNFFRRYYKEGDFLSLRRYKEGVYAIPYEGEEVKLYWANHDQYYIKTSEYLRDYSFTLPNSKKVHFKLKEADIEKDNRKADTNKERRFSIVEENPVVEENEELIIRFNYLPCDKKTNQKELNEQALKTIFDMQGLDNWIAALSAIMPTDKNPNRTILEKHLNDYTSRYSFDYFIHKDLGGFLRHELDFYIKNEIMHLDDIESETAPKVEQYLSKIKVIRQIAHKIILFLEQLENFQKKLWLKKKFVVETNYCVTLDKVPQELYSEIAVNDAQREEWIQLFAINEIEKDLATHEAYSEPLTEAFLQENPYLMLDTKFFDYEFKEKLLVSFENIDEQMDGLLIHSENFQALNFIQDAYRGQINCIYADPPYNAKSSEILYKNSFKHSSWISLMCNRILLSNKLKTLDGALIIAIDENEFDNLSKLFDDILPSLEKTCISIVHNPAGVQGDNFSYSHEYCLFVFEKKKNIIGKTGRIEDSEEAFRDWGGTSARTLAKNCFYPILVQNDEIIGFGDVCPDDFHPDMSNIIENEITYIYPISKDGEERKWVFSRNSVEEIKNELNVRRRDNELVITRTKSVTSYKTVWNDNKYYANIYGSKLLNHIFGSKKFDFPKSVYTVRECIFAVNSFRNKTSICLDYFAGSGTTGHAVIDLNREDDGNRKYMLVEMGEYFDTVTKPRIQKVVYSKDWKDGKPVNRDTGISHIFKYIRLEGYEDCLNNLVLKRTDGQQSLLENNQEFRETYMLGYMLDTESAGSASLLNIDAFEDPFNYKLNIATGSVGETRPVNIDLVETFNYLLGLRVKHIDTIRGYKVVEGYNPKNEKVLVIWRNTKEKSNEDLEEFFTKQQYNTLDMEFDLIYVNGDNNLENLKKDEDTWKVRLIEEEFQRLMFDVQDV